MGAVPGAETLLLERLVQGWSSQHTVSYFPRQCEARQMTGDDGTDSLKRRVKGRICVQHEQPSLNRGEGLQQHLSAAYNAALTSFPFSVSHGFTLKLM